MVTQKRKLRLGTVIGTKMDKTVVVAVRWEQRDRIYKKNIRRITKFYVHDENNQCSLGDVVRIQETRALSRLKRWKLLEIVERREVADVKPADLNEGLFSEQAEGRAAQAQEGEDQEEDAIADMDEDEDAEGDEDPGEDEDPDEDGDQK
jgi:small subunit ribosomal protein S17